MEPEGTVPEVQEVDVEQLRSELDKVKTERDTYEGNWKDAQRITSRKDKQIQELEKQARSAVSREDLNTLRMEIAALQEEKGETDYESDKPARSTSRLEQLKAEMNKEQERIKQEEQWNQYRGRVSELEQRVIDAGFDPDDSQFDTVQLSITQGRLDKAEAKNPGKSKKDQTADLTPEQAKARGMIWIDGEGEWGYPHAG